MERFRQKRMMRDEGTQLGWGDTANYFQESDEMYDTSNVSVPSVVRHHTDDDAAAPAPTTFGDIMECPDIVSGISQMPQGTS
jgi:hypothetical protein